MKLFSSTRANRIVITDNSKSIHVELFGFIESLSTWPFFFAAQAAITRLRLIIEFDAVVK
jgi:hypothetical protein